MGYCITFITNRIGGRKITYSEHCSIRQFDGVIIACINYDDPQVVELVGSGIPIVTIDHIFNNTISVMSDNVKGVKDLVEYLYSMGHKRIAFIHGQDSSVTRDNKLLQVHGTTGNQCGTRICSGVQVSRYRGGGEVY